jgi:hypothetical protein
MPIKSFLQTKIELALKILLILLYVCSETSLAQSQRVIDKSALRYKYRDGNRWEGVKASDWKPMSGALELVSIVFREKKWLQNTPSDLPDSVSIFFDAPIKSGINVSVFNADFRYYMDPHSRNFGTQTRNSFKWSATILRALDLPVNKLEAKASARIQNKLTYFPIYFFAPGNASDSLIAEFSFILNKTSPIFLETVTLSNENSRQTIKIWHNIRLEPFELKPVYWRIEGDSLEHVNFKLSDLEKLVTTQKKTRAIYHEFNIYTNAKKN